MNLDDAPAAHVVSAPWKVLLVDDEPAVHEVSRLILARMSFEGREVELIAAASAAHARDLLGRHADIALVLLDVVMETEDAGLAPASGCRATVSGARQAAPNGAAIDARLRGAKGSIDGKIEWLGSPLDIDYASLGGRLRVEHRGVDALAGGREHALLAGQAGCQLGSAEDGVAGGLGRQGGGDGQADRKHYQG